MFARDLSFLEEEHICPHCKGKMSCCEAPAIHVGDGLGWGSDVLFICLNDACSLFLNGWDQIENQYGHHASYRYMELPGTKESNVMMVGNKDAFKASVIDPEALRNQNERYRKQKKAIEDLKTCVEDDNLEPVMTLLLDESASKEIRKKAIDLLPKLGNLDCIDPIRNHEFRDKSFEQTTNLIIQALLKKNYSKECPFCMEIVKATAKKCKHCKENLN